MDLNELATSSRTTLLTLPRSDLHITTTRGAASPGLLARQTPSKEATAAKPPPPAAANPLVLLQLPQNWTPADLQNSRIVANDSQASLMTDQTSWQIARVETSNVWIILQGSNTKQRRLDNDSLSPLPVRLLKPGGAGASFLECRPPQQLALRDLQRELPTWDGGATTTTNTDNNNTTGRTVTELSYILQRAPAQIQAALRQLRPDVLRLPDDDDDDDDSSSSHGYVRLSEELLDRIMAAVVHALAEEDELEAFARMPIGLSRAVTLVGKYVSDDEVEYLEHVVQHCLQTLVRNDNGPVQDVEAPVNNNDFIQLDVAKVAQIVATQLLQTKCYEETALLTKWRSYMPGGVGPDYQVHVDMLRGVAVPVVVVRRDDDDDNEEQRVWHYLPVRRLRGDLTRRFARLFAVLPTWTEAQLTPYLAWWAAETGQSAADLLAQHAAAVATTIVQPDGTTGKMYGAR